MSKPYYLLFLALVAVLGGCSAAGPPRPSPSEVPSPVAEASPETAAPLPALELTPELMYELLVAEVAGQRGNLSVSAANYRRVALLTRDPRIVERATRIALYAGDVERAVEVARLWVELEPEDMEARQSLASLLIRHGRIDEAVTHLEKVVALSPEPGQGFLVVANLLGRTPDRQGALEAMDRLLEGRRDNPPALYAQAQLAYMAGRMETALESLDALLQIEPQTTRALVLRANVLRKLGQDERALESFRQAVASDPDNTDLRLNYARLLIDARQFEQARRHFRQVEQQRGDDADVSYALGLLALQAGDLDEAERHFRRLLEAGKRMDDARYSLGRIAEDREQYQTAMDWYQSVSGGGNYLEAQIRVAILLARQGQLEQGRAYLNDLEADTIEGRVRLRLVEGDLLRRAERYREAKAVYDRALAQFPDDLELLYARAMVEEKLDRVDLLERDLHRILELDPDNAQALNALGYTLADRTERHQEALEYIRRALEQSPDDPAIIDSMGWVLYRLGRPEQALEYLRRAADMAVDGEIAAHLGEVLWTLGRKEEARQVWEKALEQFPEHRSLEQVIERLTR